MSPFWNAILPGTIAITLAALVAFAAARLRFSVPRGVRIALDILFLLPLVLPCIALGFTAAQELRPLTLIIMAESLVTLPLFYLCAAAGFRRVQSEWIDAARLQGLGRCGIFWRVWFPAAGPWLAAGFVLGLLKSALIMAILYA